MFRTIKGLILLLLIFQQAYGQNIPNPEATFVVTSGDRISWIIAGFSSGGQLRLNQTSLNHTSRGDTLLLSIPAGLQQGGILSWQPTTGTSIGLGRLLVRFDFTPSVTGIGGHWISSGSGSNDTLHTGFQAGWRALTWPRNAGNQPPVNDMGSPNRWELADTSLWLINDTIGGNEITGPDSMRVRFIGSKEAVIKNGHRCFVEVFPSAPFTLYSSILGNLTIESAFPVQFQVNKLELTNSLRINAPQCHFPDSVFNRSTQNLEWINLGDSLFFSHLMLTGGGSRKLIGNWVIDKSLQADTSVVTLGSLIWNGDSSSVLVGNFQLDRLIVLPERHLKLTSPIRLMKSNQATSSQLLLMNRSVFESDTSGFIWEGSHLGFGNIALENQVTLRLKSISLRKLWPSGSRLKVLHPGDLQLFYAPLTQGLLEWPDSTNRKLGRLTIGDSSRWEVGTSFNGTWIEKALVVEKHGTLELPDSRFLQLSPQANLQCQGTLECQDSEGLVGTQAGSIRALNQQIQLSDSSSVIYNGGSQKISPIPFYPELILGNTGLKTLEQGIQVKRSLTIQGTNTRLDADTCTLVIGKDFIINSTSGNGFSEGQSTLIFTHPQARFVTSGFQNTETVYALEVKPGARLWLQNNLSVKSGGRLLLETGAILDADTMDLSGGGNLRLMNGSHLILRKNNELLPGLSGNSATYQIDSSAIIELAGSGSQVLRGSRKYGRLVFSNQGSKYLSSSLTQPPTSIEVKYGTAFFTEQYRYAGTNTQLQLDSLAILNIRGIGSQPEAGGSWQVHPQSTIKFKPNSTLPFFIKAGMSYPNLIIERGELWIKANDTITFHSGSNLLQIDTGASFQISDSSWIGVPPTGFNLTNNGSLECRHQAGMFGQAHSAFGANHATLTGSGLITYSRNSSTQRIDSLEFNHLTLIGNSSKILPTRLVVKGHLSINGGSFRLPDTLIFSGLDTQKIQIPRINHAVLRNGVKLLNGKPQLFGNLFFQNGAKITQRSLADTLNVQHLGRIWTDDAQAVAIPISWIYRHPLAGEGWRLTGFPLAFPLDRFKSRYNFTDTLNPTIKGYSVHHGIPSWVALSQKTPTITWNDTLFTPFSEAWMIKSGSFGLLRTTADSIKISGDQLPVIKSVVDNVVGWRCISNPFLQDLHLLDTSRHSSTGLKQAYWRWGGLQHPGWQLFSPNMLLVDSALNTDLTQLAPSQSALVYRVAPGQTVLRSASNKSTASTAASFRSTQTVQHDIELTIRLGRRIRQKIGLKTISGVQADTLRMPPLPDGEKEVIGWFNPSTVAQGLLLPELTSGITIPLYVSSWKNDTLAIDFNIKQLAPGWQVFLYDSLTQQFHMPGQTYLKRIPFWVGQRLALHLIQAPVAVSDHTEEPIYRIQGDQIVLTESAEWLKLYSLQGQLIDERKSPSSSESIKIPNGSPAILHIKKGEKQWVNTIFRP